MKPLRVSLAALALLFGLALALHAQDKAGDSPYFPLKVGTKWTYQVGDRKMNVRVVKHEKVGGVTCALLESTAADGSVALTEHVAATDAGVFRHTFNGLNVEPGLCLLKLPPKKGETWKVEAKVQGQELKGTFTAGEEEVTVPAGKFKAVTASTRDFDAGGQTITMTYYFARGVGVVKQVVSLGGQEVVMELEKHEAP